MKNLRKSQKGSALIMAALAMTVLVGMVSLVTDAGLLYLGNQQLSNALDAAALAGAQVLPQDPQGAVILAKEYAEKNGLERDEVQVTITNGNKIISVSGNKQVNYFFARIFGYDKAELNKTAQAGVGSLAEYTGIVPLSIDERELYYGEEYVLKYGAGEDPEGTWHSGWFGTLALGGGGADTYRENLCSGYLENVKIGDVLDLETGNMSNPTMEGVEHRLAECRHTPPCTFDSYQPDCERIMIVPIIKPYGHKTVEVTGFAAFFLEGVGGQGNTNYIYGRFIRLHVPGEFSTGNSEDYGVYGVYLRS